MACPTPTDPRSCACSRSQCGFREPPSSPATGSELRRPSRRSYRPPSPPHHRRPRSQPRRPPPRPRPAHPRPRPRRLPPLPPPHRRPTSRLSLGRVLVDDSQRVDAEDRATPRRLPHSPPRPRPRPPRPRPPRPHPPLVPRPLPHVALLRLDARHSPTPPLRLCPTRTPWPSGPTPTLRPATPRIHSHGCRGSRANADSVDRAKRPLADSWTTPTRTPTPAPVLTPPGSKVAGVAPLPRDRGSAATHSTRFLDPPSVDPRTDHPPLRRHAPEGAARLTKGVLGESMRKTMTTTKKKKGVGTRWRTVAASL